MKNNTRKSLIATFSGMLALTAASATTAGIAWFTTTRTATVSFPNATLISNRAELKVGAFGTNGTTNAYIQEESDTDGYDGTMDSLSSVDGVNFYNALLDVDGTELGKFLKVANPDTSEFGFSANTQTGADTDLGVYMESMELTVTNKATETIPEADIDEGKATLDKIPTEIVSAKFEWTTTAEEVVSEHEDNELEVAIKKDTQGANTAEITVAGIEEHTGADADSANLIVEYRYEVEADDPIKNSVRVALFAKEGNGAVEMGDVAVEENKVLVWDTTDSASETHRGVKEVEKGKVAVEEHTIVNPARKWFDLKNEATKIASVKSTATHEGEKEMFTAAAVEGAYTFTLAELPEAVEGKVAIEGVALTKVAVNGVDEANLTSWALADGVVTYSGDALEDGDLVDIFYSYNSAITYTASAAEYGYTNSGRRVTLVNDDLTANEKVTVTYRYDLIDDVTLENSETAADLYFAGSDLKKSDENNDADLTDYGVFLGNAAHDRRLDVVIRAWIEGTDADHNLEGDEYAPNDKHSIDISNEDYKVSMNINVVGIDVDVA